MMRNIRTESVAKKEKHKQKSNTYKTGRPGEKDCSHRAAHFYYKNNSITNTTAQHATET